MLAFIYLVTAFANRPPSFLSLATTLALFVITSVGIASFGQLMNDLTDIQQDVRSGASNIMAARGNAERLLLFGLVLILGIAPWFWLPRSSEIIALLAVEYLLFIFYSAPPVRLKARGLLGAVTDSLYGYVVTNAVAILVFAKRADSDLSLFALAAAIWMFVFGLGHIIQHQLIDASRDHVDGISTFVVERGWPASLGLLRNVLLPLDYLAFFGLLCVIGSRAPMIPLFFVIHLALIARWWQSKTCWDSLGFNRLSYIDQVNLLSNHGMAHFVWHWLPPLSLITLVQAHPAYLPLVIPHLLLFPKPLQVLRRQGGVIVGRLLG